jgi:hypothetical protein
VRCATRSAAFAAHSLFSLPASSAEPVITRTAVGGALSVTGALRAFDGAV